MTTPPFGQPQLGPPDYRRSPQAPAQYEPTQYEPAQYEPAQHGQTQFMPQATPAAAPAPSVYHTRSHVQRRRVLIGLAGVALLLIGYGIGRWQGSGSSSSPAAAVAPSPTPAASAAPTTPSAAPTTSAPPSPTVYQTMQAEDAAALTGIQTQDTTDDGGGKNVGWIASGDSMRYDNVEFGPVAATKLEVRVASDGGDGGRMEVHIDSPEQPAVGVLSVTSTGGWQNWRTDVVQLTTPVTGTHTVFFTFAKDDGNEFVNINWFLFQH